VRPPANQSGRLTTNGCGWCDEKIVAYSCYTPRHVAAAYRLQNPGPSTSPVPNSLAAVPVKMVVICSRQQRQGAFCCVDELHAMTCREPCLASRQHPLHLRFASEPMLQSRLSWNTRLQSNRNRSGWLEPPSAPRPSHDGQCWMLRASVWRPCCNASTRVLFFSSQLGPGQLADLGACQQDCPGDITLRHQLASPSPLCMSSFLYFAECGLVDLQPARHAFPNE
jgi:hypothetical protein